MEQPENETLLVTASPSPSHRFVWDRQSNILKIPKDWDCLRPGDAAVTKTLKSLGPTWTATHKKGRKVFSDGVWASADNIEEARRIVAEKRVAPGYANKREAALKRRENKQAAYEANFYDALLKWLCFHPRYQTEAEKLAHLISEHAVPIGSGTVARTERIPIEQRASSAAIAWMRHQTTAYDNMHIPLVKGKRREVRRELALQSKNLLLAYRSGNDVDKNTCPLARAFHRTQE
jgi:hypothetical protein